MTDKTDTTVEDASNIRKAGAFLLDFFTIFFVAGWVIDRVLGNVPAGGLTMGLSTALTSVAFVIFYFVIAKYFGGTLWQRIIRIK